MNRTIIILTTIFLVTASCEKQVYPKPDKLVSRDQMIDILIDIHLLEAIYQSKRYSDESFNQYKDTEVYYTILNKHGVADTSFEQSIIFYSGKPKEFEKIYSRVLSRMNEMEQDLAKKENQPVDIGN